VKYFVIFIFQLVNLLLISKVTIEKIVYFSFWVPVFKSSIWWVCWNKKLVKYCAITVMWQHTVISCPF